MFVSWRNKSGHKIPTHESLQEIYTLSKLVKIQMKKNVSHDNPTRIFFQKPHNLRPNSKLLYLIRIGEGNLALILQSLSSGTESMINFFVSLIPNLFY
jgi:hypothetical protein